MNGEAKQTGRLTLPIQEGMDREIAMLVEKWGADAVRNSDGTELPDNVAELGLEVYSTLSPVRYDQPYIKAHPQYYPQKYLMTDPATARGGALEIPLMAGYFDRQFAVDTLHDPKKWFAVSDRTAGTTLPPEAWDFDPDKGTVTVHDTEPYHVYTVSFLVFQIWDTTSMYNHVTNHWTSEPISLVNPWHPEVQQHILENLDTWLKDHPATDVVRFTSLAYHFTNNFTDMDGALRSRYRDWVGYHDCTSVPALEEFERERGTFLGAEDLTDQGFMNDVNRIPSPRYLAWMDFVQKKVARMGREWVDAAHRHGRKTMMFFCDHWIGAEPYGPYFADLKLDGIVNPCMNGVELRRIADIPVPIMREVRLYPYLFPLNLEGKPGFAPGGDPAGDCRTYWMNVRRAMVQNPVDRIGFGGYLSLAVEFPDFLDYVEQLAAEFRSIHHYGGGTKPYRPPFKVGLVNCWGAIRSWMDAELNNWTKPYRGGVTECLSGMNLDVEFLSFDDLLEHGVPGDVGVLINMGDADTSWSGGNRWAEERLVTVLRRWVDEGGGFIGMSDPSACARQGHFFQLHDVLGVDRERGQGISAAKPPFEKEAGHFILEDHPGGYTPEQARSGVYKAAPTVRVLAHEEEDIHLAVNTYGKGRSVYLAEDLPFGPEQVRLLARMIFWAAGQEDAFLDCFSSNPQVECAAFPEKGMLVLINNTGESQTTSYRAPGGAAGEVELEAFEMRWMEP